MAIKTDGEASVVVVLTESGWRPPTGTRHAAMVGTEEPVPGGTTITWYRPKCQRAWRPASAFKVFDYRYREGTLCRHQACQAGFKEMTDSLGGDPNADA